jgi:hypothetical protein
MQPEYSTAVQRAARLAQNARPALDLILLGRRGRSRRDVTPGIGLAVDQHIMSNDERVFVVQLGFVFDDRSECL